MQRYKFNFHYCDYPPTPIQTIPSTSRISYCSPSHPQQTLTSKTTSTMPITVGSQPLLGPVLGLVSWTFVMEAWMYALRLPALGKYNVKTDPDMTKESGFRGTCSSPRTRWCSLERYMASLLLGDWQLALCFGKPINTTQLLCPYFRMLAYGCYLSGRPRALPSWVTCSGRLTPQYNMRLWFLNMLCLAVADLQSHQQNGRKHNIFSCWQHTLGRVPPAMLDSTLVLVGVSSESLSLPLHSLPCAVGRPNVLLRPL